MNTKQLEKLAAKLGAEIEIEEEHVIAWAPDGSVWEETGTQAMTRQFSNGSQSWKLEAFAELADDMRRGLYQETDN